MAARARWCAAIMVSWSCLLYTSSATVQADLSKAFNGIGITSDGKAFTGGLDGLGYAYSGSLLQSTEVLGGIPFQLGAADKVNVVSGASGAIALPAGKYSSLLALGTGVNGAQLAQPVSYTHLDVYKRQVSPEPSRRASDSVCR